jgi:hypothetical protein
MHDTFQCGALATQLLRPRRVIPYAGLGELQFYFGQTVLAIGKVKDTP